MKKVIALLLAVLMLASLAACSSTPANADAATPAETGTTPSADTTDTADTTETKDETPAAAGDVTIRMWTFLDPTNTSNGRSIALQKMIDRFEEENPGVKVVVEPQQWDTMTGKFMAAATTGEAPDIMWCARDELFGVLNAGLLEPLENLFMGDWTQEQIDDVDDGFFRFGERDGKHYTLCLNKNCTGFFYREDLLEAAGLEVPTTFDELYDAAQKLTQEIDGQQVYGLGMRSSTGCFRSRAPSSTRTALPSGPMKTALPLWNGSRSASTPALPRRMPSTRPSRTSTPSSPPANMP